MNTEAVIEARYRRAVANGGITVISQAMADNIIADAAARAAREGLTVAAAPAAPAPKVDMAALFAALAR